MKRLFILVTVLLFLFFCTSCSVRRAVRFVPEGYNDSDDSASALPSAIGLSLTGSEGFEDAFLKAAESYAEKSGFIAKTRYADMDADKQAEDILFLIEEGAMALIVNPVDVDAIGDAVDECAGSGIKVINILDPINAKVDSLICADYMMMGRKGARLAKEAKKDRGFDRLDILLLESEAESFPMQLIHDGFTDELGDEGSITGVRHFSREEQSTLEGLEDAELANANVIFAWNEEIFKAVMSRNPSAAVICCGASAETLGRVSDKSAYASIFFGADFLAKNAVEQAVKCAGDPLYEPPEYIELPLGVASESSVESYISAALEGYPDPS